MSESPAWLQKNWQSLHRAIRNKKIASGYYFWGEKGIGKIGFAKTFARALLCQHALASEKCDCQGCHLFLADTHPDALTLTLEAKQSIGIEQVRNMLAKANLTASMHARKVVLIYPADALTLAAANSLLKGVEEPSKNTVYILVTDSQSALPATLRSRLQCIHLSSPSAEQAYDYLKAHYDASLLKQAQSITQNNFYLTKTILDSEVCDIWLNCPQYLRDYLANKLSLSALMASFTKLPLSALLAWLSEYYVRGYREQPKASSVIWQNLMRALQISQESNSVNSQLLLEALCITWHNSVNG